MALKKMLHRLTAPASELAREELQEFCARVPGAVPIEHAQPRHEVTVVGEISSLRIVPRPDGSPWLEATVTDGTGSLIVFWTGRRKIAGVRPGQRLVVTGRGAPTGPGRRLVLYNPRYELVAAH